MEKSNKTFWNNEGIKQNCKLAIVCQNSFGVLIEIENLEEDDNKISCNQEFI